jgi:hypothetical protein
MNTFKPTSDDFKLLGSRVGYVISLSKDPLLIKSGEYMKKKYGKKTTLSAISPSYTVWRIGGRVVTIGAEFISRRKGKTNE